MRAAKIQLQGQFSIDRQRDEPLAVQLVRQIRRAIALGQVPAGTALPSSRALARALGVSRNTVLTAYDELKSRGLIRGRRGAGMRVSGTAGVRGFDVRQVLRDAHYPSRRITFADPDGNPIDVSY